MALNEKSLRDLIHLIDAGDITPADVAADLAAAVAARDGDIGAYLHFDGDALMDSARDVTESGAYRKQALRGLPIAVKDNICVDGVKTTCASKILENYHPPYDATSVVRLRNAGAIVAGKTNLDEFAMGSSTENSALRKTKNPWNLECTPGGSSGGSAAAVSADVALATLGSDTGGSIRQPASFCGVVGMKPTYGRVSRYGLVAFASSLDQIGPLTKSVDDCAIVMNAICGHDPLDSTSVNVPVPDFAKNIDAGAKGLKVGVPRDFIEQGMDDQVGANFTSIVAEMEKAGASIVDIELPHANVATACYYIIANAEASSNLARYDGVKYGHRTGRDSDLLAMYTRTRDEGFGEEVKRRILLGTYVLSSGYYDAYYLKAQKVRSLIIDDFNRAFEKCDVISVPTSPTPAFRIGEKTADPLQMYLSDIFTIPVNLAGLPAVSVPSGLSAERLPFGIQMIGRPLDEAAVLRGGKAIETVAGFKEKAIA